MNNQNNQNNQYHIDIDKIKYISENIEKEFVFYSPLINKKTNKLRYIHILHPSLGIVKVELKALMSAVTFYCNHPLKVQEIELNLIQQENQYFEALIAKKNSKNVLPIKVFDEVTSFVLVCTFLTIFSTGNFFVKKSRPTENGYNVFIIQDVIKTTQIGNDLLFQYTRLVGFITRWDKKGAGTAKVVLNIPNITFYQQRCLLINCETINGLLYTFNGKFTSKVGISKYNECISTFFLSIYNPSEASSFGTKTQNAFVYKRDFLNLNKMFVCTMRNTGCQFKSLSVLLSVVALDYLKVSIQKNTVQQHYFFLVNNYTKKQNITKKEKTILKKLLNFTEFQKKACSPLLLNIHFQMLTTADNTSVLSEQDLKKLLVVQEILNFDYRNYKNKV